MTKSMRRSVAFLSVFVIVMMSVIGSVAADETIVQNGHFLQLAGPDRPVAWSVSVQPAGNSRYAIDIDSSAFNGDSAVRLQGADESGRAIVVQRDIAAVEYRGKMMQLSAQYKGSDVVKRSGAENFIRVEFYKREGTALSNSGPSRLIHAPEGSTDWTLLTTNFEVPPETDVMWISISLRESSGIAWWSG